MKLSHLLSAAAIIASAANVSAAIDADLNTKDALTLKRMLTAERRKVAPPAPPAAHHANMGAALEAYVQALEDRNFAPVIANFKAAQNARIVDFINELVADDADAFLTVAAVGGAKNRGQFKNDLLIAINAAAVAPALPTDKSIPGMVEYYGALQAEFNNQMIAWLESLGAAHDTHILDAGVATGGVTAATGAAEPVNDERDSLRDAIVARIH